MTEIQHTNLSTQAIGAVMMALQKSLMEQSDIVPVLEGFKMTNSPEGLVVLNPPLVKFNDEFEESLQQSFDFDTGGSQPDTVVNPFNSRED
tara:strand:+ start:25771 stop:26043 length:273 start_codon:yes stop_codon:yes gene_type:complete